MTNTYQHHRGSAGTSFTKVVAMHGCGQMCVVSIHWNKHLIGTGSQA